MLAVGRIATRVLRVRPVPKPHTHPGSSFHHAASPATESAMFRASLAVLMTALLVGCPGEGSKAPPDASREVDASVPFDGDGGAEDAGGEEPFHATCVAAHMAAELPAPPDAPYTLHACVEGRRWPVVAQVAGPIATSGSNRVAALRELLTDDELLAIPGIVGISTMTCCLRGTGPACLSLVLQSNTSGVDSVLRKVTARLHELHAGCIGVQVELLGIEAPRCEGDACRPLTLCEDPDVGDPCCPERVTYADALSRAPIADLPAELEAGTCDHDGECFRNGAGNHCTSWDTPGFFAQGICYPGLARAHCGCIEGACRWFTQE